jgi:pyruvate-formate lyase
MMQPRDYASDRIKLFRRRYLEEMPVISIERARYYTENWRQMEGDGLPLGVRVALAMRHVYEHMAHYVDPDDRIAGTWTEHFLGIPIDIERGLFNGVFEVELKKRSMFWHGLKSGLGFAAYKTRREGVLALYRTLEHSKKIGAAMPALGTDTMDRRKVNPYRIADPDRDILLRELLPYWKGKTIADRLKQCFRESDIYEGEFGDFIQAVPRGTASNDAVISTGAALGVWQGHLVLDHVTPIQKGLLAMRADVAAAVAGTAVPEERHFLESVDIALEGVAIYARRLAEKLEAESRNASDPERKATLAQMSALARKVPLYPAESFREAVQSYWTVKTAVELAIPFNVHAPGRLDQVFYPYYRADIERGRITRDEARELLEELFLKVMSHNLRPYSNASSAFSQRYEGSEPVTLGGLTEDGEDATNDLTYVMLEAADRSKASLNFAVRIHERSPDALLMAIAALHYHGVSSVSLMNDAVCMRALQKRGFTERDARNYAITGCVDACAPGKTGGEGFSSLLLCRTLDMALRNGDSQTLLGLIKDVGLKTGDPDTFATFDQFLDAFLQQGRFMLRKIVEASTMRDRLYAEHLPAPFISAFMQGCLQSKRDVTRGGAVYDCEGILFMTSIANTVDSLYVIKKLIFERKAFTFAELLAAIDNNFSNGHGRIHKAIVQLEGKWGNGNPESDELARRVTSALFEETYRYETYKGGFYAPFINSMTTHTYDGRISIATPDGRLAGKPFAASCNPYNVEAHGPTGVLRSVAALDFEHVLGSAVNIRMHPSGIGQSEEARRKWIALWRTYFDLGGEQLQPTVVSTEVLRAAQRDPESYRNVIVKVGGYSAYFVDLGREIQDEIISRTEHCTG